MGSEARSCALAVGWLQIVADFSSLTYGVLSLLFLVGAIVMNEEDDDNSFLITTAANMLALTIIMGFRLFAAFTLVIGVKQENVYKLKIWLLINVTFLGLMIVKMAVWIFVEGVRAMDGFSAIDLATTITYIFWVWIVNIHRQELFAITISRPYVKLSPRNETTCKLSNVSR